MSGIGASPQVRLHQSSPGLSKLIRLCRRTTCVSHDDIQARVPAETVVQFEEGLEASMVCTTYCVRF